MNLHRTKQQAPGGENSPILNRSASAVVSAASNGAPMSVSKARKLMIWNTSDAVNDPNARCAPARPLSVPRSNTFRNDASSKLDANVKSGLVRKTVEYGSIRKPWTVAAHRASAQQACHGTAVEKDERTLPSQRLFLPLQLFIFSKSLDKITKANRPPKSEVAWRIAASVTRPITSRLPSMLDRFGDLSGNTRPTVPCFADAAITGQTAATTK